MTLDTRSRILDEVEGWRPFGEALKADDRELYTRMMERCCNEYLPSMEVRAEPFPSEALFMGLIFLQHRTIERLSRRLENLERRGH